MSATLKEKLRAIEKEVETVRVKYLELLAKEIPIGATISVRHGIGNMAGLVTGYKGIRAQDCGCVVFKSLKSGVSKTFNPLYQQFEIISEDETGLKPNS